MARVIKTLWLLVFLLPGKTTAADLDPGGAEQDYEAGRYGEALKRWEAALPKLSGPDRFDTLLSMAAAYRALGQVGQVFDRLNEAHALAEQSQDKARQALALANLSDAYLLARRLEEALEYAERGVNLARQAAATAVLAATLNHLGNALLAQERYSEALRVYGEGTALAEQLGDTALAAALLTNTVHGHLAAETPEAAIPPLTAALKKTRALPLSHDKAYGLVGLGYLAQRLAMRLPPERDRLIQSAYQAFDEAHRVAEQLHDVRANAYATGHLGELYGIVGQQRDAEQRLRQALFFAAQAEAPELSARWQWQLGRALKAQGRIEEAKTAYRAALDRLGSIQSALLFGQRGDPRSFREGIGAIYLELAEILLQEAESTASVTPRQAALREVRQVMERFKSAELQSYFLDECVTALQSRVSQRAIEQLVDPRTATLYPILFPKRTVLLLGLADESIEFRTTAVDATELRQTVTAFREALASLGNPRRLRHYGLRLYEWLVAPIAPILAKRGIDTLVVVPDDALRMIPFAALFDGNDFLVKRYAFAVTPGLTLTDPEVFAARRPQVLLGGLSEAVQEFEPLPYVSREIEEIASLYGGTQLVDSTFVKPAVQSELRRTPYSVINFATHAQILPNPRQSFLLTHDDRITFDELEDLVRISEFRERPVELMVLSACDTAEGDERAALGLAGVALKAGARSVMASLWAVNDASTAELVPQFFQNLRDPALNKAQALQRAQQHLLTQSDYQHPFYWAPFLLIGNWR
jgi:CHAT domain-containing protein